MPEVIEVEQYRRLADRALDRRIDAVLAPDDWFLKGATTAAELRAVLVAARLTAARRIGKLLLLDTDTDTDTPGADPDADAPGGAVLGLRFGMTGRLIVDGRSAIDRLEYASGRDEARWERFGLDFSDGGSLRISDPRRLGGVRLDPPTAGLGPDAWSLTPRQLRAALAGSDASLKARLLDQHRIAGLGNLLTDEVLWRAGLDPARPAGSLSPAELRRLHRHLGPTLDELDERGGSHTGRLQPARTRGASCPRDGAPLDRRTIGGRTTYSCPRHQR